MKTIEALSKAVSILGEDVRVMNINGFEYVGGFRSRFGAKKSFDFKFTLICQPKHFQTLKNMGVRLNFNDIRKAAHGARINSNTVVTVAIASIESLEKINKFSRENHLGKVDINNDHNLALAGWYFKEKKQSVENKDLQNHLEKQALIRKAARKLLQAAHRRPVTNFEKKCMNK